MDKIMPEPADNPLRDFDKWMADPRTFPTWQWFRDQGFLRLGEPGYSFETFSRLHTVREWFISKYGFSLPTKEAIEALVKLSPLIEVGAGSGYWSRILSNAGAQILATDAVRETEYGFKIARHFPVVINPAEAAIKGNPGINVLMSWPCYDQLWSTKAVRAMKRGTVLALIGEGEGGCTGSDYLFRVLESQFEPIECKATVAQFPGINDYLQLYRKK